VSDLENIYSGLKPTCDNEICDGCSILKKNKPVHAYMDYENLTEGKVLFLSDSFKYRLGKMEAFSKKDIKLLRETYPHPAQYSSSIKCPSVKDEDLLPVDKKKCRNHLEATIDKVKPLLVFCCGNLPMKMLIKKSGITNKRGSSFPFTTEAGHTCTVVPIYHPYSVTKEPRHRYLFEIDIKNAHQMYVLGKRSDKVFSYEALFTVEEVEALVADLDNDQTKSVDIETTGLNFKTDLIQSIAFSIGDRNIAIPLDHKDSPFKQGEPDRDRVWAALKTILENPRAKKPFHNVKFDLKFLIRYGIHAKNIRDTKVLHHSINENAPKSLMDLIKLYFADELENL